MTPGVLIAAARSSSGKTTLALGLMRALTRRGMRVAAVKCGPDYIDPAFHAAATGRDSLNLDSWAMEADTIVALAALAGADADIIVAEGAMGLFDGAPGGAAGVGASADVAALLGWPVLIAHDVSGQAQTAAALLRGLSLHDPRVVVAGVVLNRVGSERHERLVAESLQTVGLPVFGSLPRSDAITLPERHLGLVQAGETAEIENRLEALADFVEAHVDVDAVVASARAGETPPPRMAPNLAPPAQCIAVARDDAFSFFYPHLAQSWRRAGAELRFFSPLANEPPPQDCDLCWLPGGYPELHAGKLAAANMFFEGLRRFSRTKPVHGECGGYMALGRVLIDADGRPHRMAELLGLETTFAKRRLHLGYRRATIEKDHFLGPAGRALRGHEFHYASVLKEEGTPFVQARDAYRDADAPAGLRDSFISGSFFHLIN
ncbi:cobyrinate a,c-diamide synthase [Methylocystis parvus]|uniref:Hydrogenobyrinate a,c-diamide synthase n=1 Tax=Methylocystis parvus TaxID=134 RepID=A0A6B8LXF8_9HYPH|nr:cobyrinate a,c-diamide synthase [Methylocystis parvus]QGM96134.1 cobyrinate a,c-diamide synthase [Methylocystis parvus]WBK00044.1 cobyrinate a,c-diamide synthase [Methylocystis parvus OBBP]